MNDARRSRTRWLVAAVVAFALGAAFLVQPVGCSQTAHYAFVRSLAGGTPNIDRYHWQTCDKSYTNGHFYANKAPGLDFLGVPLWLALRSVGLARDHLPSVASPAALYDVPPTAVWPLTLWTVGLPAVLLLLLTRRLADALEPGYGTATALTLALGTLMLPLATLLFSHVLAALLGLVSIALLLRERAGPPRALLTAAAGLFAGFATLTEYPLALVALAGGAYVLVRPPRLARAAAYASGGFVGLLPLALYNWWAFGTVGTLSYANVVLDQGQSGHDRLGGQPGGFFGVDLPNARVALELLFSEKGLLTLSPIVALAAAGLVPLYRSGRRAEALLVAGLGGAFLTYNSGYFIPFGGSGPGTRFLAPVLPLLIIPLAIWWRRLPATTLALAAVSVLTALLVTSTEPLLEALETRRWFERLRDGDFTETLLTSAGAGSGWLAIAPFFAAVALAATCGLAATPLRFARRDLEVAAVALLAWAALALAGRALLDFDEPAGASAQLALVLLAVAAVTAVLRVHEDGPAAASVAAPLLAMLVPPLAADAAVVALAASATLAGAALRFRRARRPRPA